MKHKAFKFRLTPNQQQKVLINKTLGCCRFLFNQMLSERIDKYTNKDTSKTKSEKQYKIDFDWLKEVDSISLQQSRIDLYNAYTNFFRRIKKNEKPGFPKFKSRKHPKNSYRTINVNNSIRIEDNYIRIPKLGFVKFKKSRKTTGEIKSVTITKNILGKYYISVLCETEIDTLLELDTKIGIDLGIKDFCVISDNTKISNPSYLRTLEFKLKRVQRTLSRRIRNSNRREKARKKVFRVHEKIANQRSDFLHKLSTKLINENQVICLEDLSVKNMVKNHCLAKSISDCSWSKFVELLKYKANWYGRKLIKIDKFFPSSKMCSDCGYIKNDLTLKDREWKCPACGTFHDRDHNAALNILEEGLRILDQNRRDGEDSSVNNKTLVLCS